MWLLTPKISCATTSPPRGFPAGSARQAEIVTPSAAVSWIQWPIRLLPCRRDIADDKQNAPVDDRGVWLYGVPDNDLLSRARCALSSACCRFTVLFEMGRSGSGRLWSSGVGRMSWLATSREGKEWGR